MYGVNTGFGALAEVRIDAESIRELQQNLVRSHAAGVGEPLPRAVVRGMLLLRAAVLATGQTGVRPLLCQRCASCSNEGCTRSSPGRARSGLRATWPRWPTWPWW